MLEFTSTGRGVFCMQRVVKESHLTISIRPGACRADRLSHLNGAHDDILRKNRRNGRISNAAVGRKVAQRYDLTIVGDGFLPNCVRIAYVGIYYLLALLGHWVDC